MSDLNDIMNMSNSEMDKILEGFVGKPRKEVEYELAVIRQEIQAVANTIPSKGNPGEQGPQGVAGKDGIQGKNGKDGLQGPRGFDGKDGKDGLDGEKGQDGVSVVNAYLDFDNSLTLELSDGSVIDAGQFNLPENIQNIIQSLKKTGPSTLASLDDVNVASATDSQVLTYNSATSKWIPATVSAGGGGTVTSVTATSPVTSTGGTTPVIAMPAATTSVNGYLTSTDWTTFNGKYSVGGALGTPSSGTLSSCTGLPLSTGVTGTLPIANGGTNATATPTLGGVIVGTGTAYSTTAAGTSGQVLTSNGAAAPTWQAAGGGSSSLTIDNKTAAYTIVTGDLGKVINCTSGTFTISLTAAATLGSGFNVTIWNTSSTSTHVITIDPNGAETIDGSDTITLRLGEGTEIVSNGTNWITGNKKSMRYYAENATTLLRPVASGASSIAMGNGGYASGSNAIAIGNSRVDGFVGANNTGTIAIGSGSSAAGSYCVSIGQDSSASNLRSVAIGLSAYATANFSVAVGAAASASNNDAISIGAYSVANKVDATALGAYANASGIESTSIGSYSNATQNDATALGSYANALQPYATSIGYNAYNNTVKNKYTFGSAWSITFGTQDTASAGKYILGASTTNATTTVLTTISGAVASTNQLTLPDRAVVCFTGQVVCRTSGTVSSAWKIEGLIRRDTGVATTTLIASTVTVISNASGFTVALAADTTYGCLKISVTGAAATSLRWLATVETTEVKN